MYKDLTKFETDVLVESGFDMSEVTRKKYIEKVLLYYPRKFSMSKKAKDFVQYFGGLELCVPRLEIDGEDCPQFSFDILPVLDQWDSFRGKPLYISSIYPSIEKILRDFPDLTFIGSACAEPLSFYMGKEGEVYTNRYHDNLMLNRFWKDYIEFIRGLLYNFNA
jgi:hypothetical protein